MAMEKMGRAMEEQGDGHGEMGVALGEDMVERILLRLPMSSCIRFASVCTDWYSTITSPSFSALASAFKQGTHPFLFLSAPSSPPSLLSSCIYDPLALRWFPISPFSPRLSFRLVSSSPGSLISFASHESSLHVRPESIQSRLLHALNPTSLHWKSSSPSLDSFGMFPVLTVFDTSPLSPHTFKVFVLVEAGALHPISNQLYDSATDEWEFCEPLPRRWFIGPIGSFSISSAVLGHKIYVSGISSGNITCFDVDKKTWSEVLYLKGVDAMYSLIASGDGGLYVIAVCHGIKDTKCLKLFKVDVATMDCEEVSKMPQHIWALFADQPQLHLTSLKCMGVGALIYVYYGSSFNNIRICSCDIDDGYKWHQLPPLPSALLQSNVRAECCALQLLPTTFFKSRITRALRETDHF